MILFKCFAKAKIKPLQDNLLRQLGCRIFLIFRVLDLVSVRFSMRNTAKAFICSQSFQFDLEIVK